MYYLYFTSDDVQLKDAITIPYGDSLRPPLLTERTWNKSATKRVETYVQDGDDVESEVGATIPDMKIYFILSEIPDSEL